MHWHYPLCILHEWILSQVPPLFDIVSLLSVPFLTMFDCMVMKPMWALQ